MRERLFLHLQNAAPGGVREMRPSLASSLARANDCDANSCCALAQLPLKIFLSFGGPMIFYELGGLYTRPKLNVKRKAALSHQLSAVSDQLF
jgi:hypothetical protein